MNFLKYFRVAPRHVEVIEYRTSAGVNIAGERGTLLAHMDDGRFCFVEFNKNIGGGSADGLGKDGHCLLLPRDVLKYVVK